MILATAIGGGCSTVNPPIPVSRPSLPPPEVAVSSISVPVRIETSAITARVDEALSTGEASSGVVWITGRDLGGGKSLQLGLNRIGPSSASTANGCVSVTVPLGINNGRIDWGEKLPLGVHIGKHFTFGGSARVTAVVCPELTADWQLKGKVMPSFNWQEGAWIDLNPPFGHIKIHIADLTQVILNSKLSGIGDILAAELSKVPVRPAVEKAWISMQQPITVSKDPPVSVLIDPLTAGVSPPISEGGSLVVSPFLAGKVVVHAGLVTSSVLPAKSLPANSGSADNPGLHAQTRIDVGFDFLNAEINSRLKGKPIDLGNGRSFTPSALALTPDGDRVVLRVDFDAKLTKTSPFSDVSGWVYLMGKPRYEDSSSKLSVQDFDFDVETRNILVRVADALLHPVVRESIGKALVFDLSSKAAPFRARVLQGVSGLPIAGGIRLDAHADKIGVSDIHVGPESIGIFATADGSASVLVSP